MTRRTTPADKLIGQRIRQRRLELHMSQTALGEQVGVSYQQMQKYERGINRVASAQLAAIAQALKVDSAFFFGDLNTGPKKASRINAFIATKDGLDISEAMIKLPTNHRRAVIDLARKLGSAA